jgi:hypothetical protein
MFPVADGDPPPRALAHRVVRTFEVGQAILNHVQDRLRLNVTRDPFANAVGEGADREGAPLGPVQQGERRLALLGSKAPLIEEGANVLSALGGLGRGRSDEGGAEQRRA